MAEHTAVAERIAVVGPRKGVAPESVEAFLHRLHRKSPDCIVVSGGLQGVDETAERTWLGLGGRVISFRPYQIPAAKGRSEERYVVQELRLSPPRSGAHPSVQLHMEPSWADFNSALQWCLRLVILRADRVVAYLPDGQMFTEVEDYCTAEQTAFYRGSEIAA